MSKKPTKAKAKAAPKASAFLTASNACAPGSIATYCAGNLSMVKGEHRGLLVFQDTRAITGSLDYDKAMSAAGDNSEKWDYAVGCKAAGNKEQCVWVEVHPANTGEVTKMLGKLAALKKWLKGDGKPLSALTPWDRKPFVWLCTSAGVSIMKGSAEERKLAMAGMDLPKRMLRLPLA